MLFHILGHIDADHGVLVAEHRLGKRAAELRLADARGAEKEKAPDGPVRVLEPDSAAPDGARHRRDRFVLPDHAAVQHILHMQQPLALALGKACDGDARPAGDDRGDILGGYGASVTAALGVPFAARLFKRAALGAFPVAQLRGKLIVLRADGLLLLGGQRCELRLDGLHLVRSGQIFHAHARRGLVHKVDRLVREKPVADIPHGELHRGGERLVRDLQSVVRFVPVAQAAQDLKALVLRRLGDRDRLEAPFKGGVLFNVFAVFRERRRADDLDLAAGEGGLEDIRRVDRALRRARADHGMQLVDEEHDVLRLADFLENVFQPVLKVAAVFCPGEHTGEIERHDALVAQILRHLAMGDALGKPLGHGGLADARFADEHRVVFRPAREDLDDARYLLVAPDHGIELAARGHLREIAAVLVKILCFRMAHRRALPDAAAARRGAVVARCEAGENIRIDLVEIAAGGGQKVRGGALRLAQYAHEQMLRADIAVAQAVCLRYGDLDDAPAAGRETLHRHARRAAAGGLFDEIHHKIFLKAVFAQHARAERVRFAHDAEQKVLGADVAVAQLHGGGARLFNGVSRLFGKSVVHIRRLLPLPMVDRFSVSQSSGAAERVVLKKRSG